MNSKPDSKTELLKIPTAAELAARISRVGADLVAIAKDLVRAVDEDPNFIEALAAQGIHRELIRRLEKFGRNQIDERLVLLSGPGIQQLMAAPLSEQREVLTSGVEVLEDDEKTVRKIPLSSLTPQQARQVFNRDHVRDIGEQRTWIRAQRAEGSVVAPAAEYKVFKDHVVTRNPGVWSKQVILGWLQQMN
jgi:hypothetical protein